MHKGIYKYISVLSSDAEKRNRHFVNHEKMSCHSCFYRSLFYFHGFIAVCEFIFTFALLVLIVFKKPDLFFDINHPNDHDWETISINYRIAIVVLFLVGAIRTVILFLFLFLLFSTISSCFCLLCISSSRTAIFNLVKSKSTNRFVSFNCNCPCYRPRPRLRFQLQFAFTLLLFCIRLATIVLCLLVKHHITTRSLAVVVAISFFFLIVASLLDYYHYRVWWHYEPQFNGLELGFQMPTTPLSPKHKRFIPYHLLGDYRTKNLGDKPCSDGSQCKIRRLEHILIFHFRGHNPQPRYRDLEQTKQGQSRYIGFHQTDPASAILIAHSNFNISTKYESTMIGHGVYFARSREGTQRKANRHGAYICAEIEMGRVLELNPGQRNLYRGKNDWWVTHDTAYFCHQDPSLDEFCVKSPTQILNWIIVIEKEFDTKVAAYGLHEEFSDARCPCI